MIAKKEKPWVDLKKLREKHGWSQTKSAEKLGFSRSYLAMVENGRQAISKSMMRATIEVYGIKYEDFYRDEG